ncbi:thymidylate kinase-domain-containing protein [Pyronema omphalodes]|nr:thymidylate kinase-domain-containing protein [Pyronema omphalodes]
MQQAPLLQGPRGALIVIEGLDRAGKSTQCTLLQQRIPHSRIVKFPDRSTPTGQIINTYLTNTTLSLDDHAIHLLFSANRWEYLPSLLSSLSAGETLILDRYIYSGIAFSCAKGLSYDYCRGPDVGLPAPDAVIFLDLPVERAEQREGFGGERYEVGEFQMRVREKFREVREREGGEWRVVDAGREREVVAEEVGRFAEQAVEAAKAGRELRRIE